MRPQLCVCALFVLALLLASLPTVSAQSVTVGKYRVPALAGWQRKVDVRQPRHIHFVRNGKTYDFDDGYSKRVEFQRTFNGVAATLELRMKTYPKATTRKEWTAGMKDADKIMAMMPGLQPVVVLKSKWTRFDGHDAYLSHTRGPVYQSRETIDNETLMVLDGRQIYMLTKTVKAITLPPQALVQIERRWKVFQKQVIASGH